MLHGRLVLPCWRTVKAYRGISLHRQKLLKSAQDLPPFLPASAGSTLPPANWPLPLPPLFEVSPPLPPPPEECPPSLPASTGSTLPCANSAKLQHRSLDRLVWKENLTAGANTLVGLAVLREISTPSARTVQSEPTLRRPSCSVGL